MFILGGFMKQCDCGCIHEDVIKDVNEKMLDDNVLIDMAVFFMFFGDCTRLKIINVLLNSRMCVCDIANLLGMTHSAISHQLKVLKKFKIVKYEKVGKIVYYELDDDHIEKIFNEGMNHIDE